MALAAVVLTPEQGAAWALGMDRLERLERVADRAAGIDRTAEQRRADLFAGLPALVLAGTAADDRWRRAAGVPTGGRVSNEPGEDVLVDDQPVPPPWTCAAQQVAAQVVLSVHVPVSTVLDLSREPGTLDCHGPSPPSTSGCCGRTAAPRHGRRPVAVAVAVDATRLREQVRDMLRPAIVTDADEPEHDPSGRLARLVDLRDVRCEGPGCVSTRCDRDRLTRWPDGPTSARDLGLVSPRCDSAQHHGWTLVRHPDGSVTWHSPLNRTYHRPGPWTARKARRPLRRAATTETTHRAAGSRRHRRPTPRSAHDPDRR